MSRGTYPEEPWGSCMNTRVVIAVVSTAETIPTKRRFESSSNLWKDFDEKITCANNTHQAPSCIKQTLKPGREMQRANQQINRSQNSQQSHSRTFVISVFDHLHKVYGCDCDVPFSQYPFYGKSHFACCLQTLESSVCLLRILQRIHLGDEDDQKKGFGWFRDVSERNSSNMLIFDPCCDHVWSIILTRKFCM